MRSGSLPLVAALCAAAACGGDPRRPAASAASADNVLQLSVDGARCAGSGSPYLNDPCVRVTICEPGTSACQTIDDVLLDTGSYGLRIARQALSLSLPQATAPGGGALAECVRFGDMTTEWGPVVTADVVLANEPAVRVPIQVMDASFGAVPASCPNPEAIPSWGNGILGVGVFAEDCGPTCPAAANVYYAWNGSAATAVAVDAPSQVQNPVAHLPVDGNGVVVALPGVPGAGAPWIEGSVVLGIGTRANNVPTAATAIALDPLGEFTTAIGGGTAVPGSFVDTGSNGLFFAPPTFVPACADAPSWFCPPSTLTLGATIAPSPGLPGSASSFEFQLGNFDALVVRSRSGNAVFGQIGGGALAQAGFDWGLPFFLGRTVYLGIEGRTSALGAGPALAW